MLPVSGTALTVREPTGEDEIYLVETALAPSAAFLGLAERVATTAAGDPVDWPGLPAATSTPPRSRSGRPGSAT